MGMGKKMRWIAAGWAAAAIAVAASGALRNVRMPMPQVMAGALTLALVAAFTASRGVRDWALDLDLRGLTLFHCWRIVPGIAFLVLYSRGDLPWAFAVPGGWGDIVVAVTAPLASALAPRHRRVVLGWHLLAAADLVNVLATAARIGMADQAAFEALRHLPFSLLPIFLVPLTLQAHFIAVAQLMRRRRA